MTSRGAIALSAGPPPDDERPPSEVIDVARVARALPNHDVAAEWFARTRRWEPQARTPSRPLFRLTAVTLAPTPGLDRAPYLTAILDVNAVAATVFVDVERRTARTMRMGDAATVAEVAVLLLQTPDSLPHEPQAAVGAASEWIG